MSSDSHKAFWKTPAGKIAVALILFLGMPGFLMLSSTVMVSTMVSSIGGVAGEATATSDSCGGSSSSGGSSDGGGSGDAATAPTRTVEQWVKDFGQYAYDTGKKYGIPWEAILTQGAFESGYGSSAPGHNYFGIRAWKDGQPTVQVPMWESGPSGPYLDTSASFAAYDSDAAGFDGYGEFITSNSRYWQALQEENRRDPIKYITAIKAAGYATDPDYVAKWTNFYNEIKAAIKKVGKKEWLPSSKVKYDREPPKAPGDGATAGGDSGSSSSGGSTTTCSNSSSDDDGNAVYGGLGDAPTKTDNFGWMCKTKLKICSPGDYGVPKISWSGDYQCYWYWLARSWLVHDGDIQNPFTANGGELYNWAQGQPDWDTSTAPRPGAGVSFWGNGNNHVAFVEKVEKDPSGWKIMISEGNFTRPGVAAGSWNTYNTRWLTKDQFLASGGTGFFWKKSWHMKS
ncbi:glucosaminidase domain-containing protein [Bifidobacterium callitrichidarum]|uniref:Peptidase C51 domain-containing protein n=1 Tax=Bifidobacterium callitrichidarum TaxID=2052941 RepID=A0A2U2N0F6_9BIFI|nr:glucosaminidase domain-containing protein [Bifidobacterium callitrichidarum]PWG62666.1 hypothetical protein DF196_11955 [Bifidobacterium callitrichidarum]